MDCGPARVSGGDSAAAAGPDSDVRETEGAGVRSEDATSAGAAAPARSGCRSVAEATAGTGTADGGAETQARWERGARTRNHRRQRQGKVDRGKAALGAACWRIGSGATGCAEGRAHAVRSDAVRSAGWPGCARGSVSGAGPAMGRSTE